jgi:peptide/nickel transport system permease protein
MLRYAGRRLAFAALLVVLVSSAALWLTRLAPGDLTTERSFTDSPEEIARAKARFGLDRSPAEQWALWLERSVRLDFGESALYERPVAGLVATAARNTAILAAAALLIATVIGIPLGIYTGAHFRLKPEATSSRPEATASRPEATSSRRAATTARGFRLQPEDVIVSAVRGVSLICLSVPPLLTTLVFVWIAARTGWLPVGGMTSAASSSQAWGGTLLDVLHHLVLPALALALPMAATLERMQSQAVSDAVREPFILAARARGLSLRRVVVSHAWRVSLGPICAFYGMAIGILLSGSFAVEYITAWPGLGRLTYEALRARDIYLVTGCAAAGAVFLALGSVISDVLLAATDPRVRRR